MKTYEIVSGLVYGKAEVPGSIPGDGSILRWKLRMAGHNIHLNKHLTTRNSGYFLLLVNINSGFCLPKFR